MEIILDQLLDGVDVNCVNSRFVFILLGEKKYVFIFFFCRNETALHYLCGGHGDKNLLKRLLKKGADPNAMNTSFETPVSLCAVMRQPVILTKLLEVSSLTLIFFSSFSIFLIFSLLGDEIQPIITNDYVILGLLNQIRGVFVTRRKEVKRVRKRGGRGRMRNVMIISY